MSRVSQEQKNTIFIEKIEQKYSYATQHSTHWRYLAWPFTILQNDNITISLHFFQADSTKVSQHDLMIS